MTDSWHPARWPASVTLPAVWLAYFGLLAATLPWTPLGVLWMLAPLLATGWYARNWMIPAAVGLGHGVLLAGVVVWLGVFPLALSDPALPLAAGLLVLLSWFTAIAGRTIRLVHVVREQADMLDESEQRRGESAASVEAVWDATTVALIALDSHARVTSWNPGAEGVFRRSAANMLGKPLADLAAPDDPDDCMAPILYALDMQSSTPPFEGAMMDGHGQRLDVEVRARPVTHPGGDQGLILTVIDHTRERIMEDVLEKQAERQDRLLQNLEEVLYSVEVPGRRTVMMTKTVEALTGQSIAAFGDFTAFLDLAHPDDLEALRSRWEHARSGEKSTLRWRLRTAGGNHVWVEDRVVGVRDDEGRVVRVDGIVRRVFQEIELERQAQRMRRWLDALEPLAGTGAWSVDLRDGDWTWSQGMADFVGSQIADYDRWARRVHEEDQAILASVVGEPELLDGPQRIRMVDPAGRLQDYVVEAWLQRGNDGEPIHVYGVLRREAHARPVAPTAPALPREAVERAWAPPPVAPSLDVAIEDTEAPLDTSVEARADAPIGDATQVPPEAPLAPDLEMPMESEPQVETTAEAEREATAEAKFDAMPEEMPDGPSHAMPDASGDAIAPVHETPTAVDKAPSRPPEAKRAAAIHALEAEELPNNVEDVVWDDDVGWVPKMKPKPLVPTGDKDDAEELAARHRETKRKPAGPWSLD